MSSTIASNVSKMIQRFNAMPIQRPTQNVDVKKIKQLFNGVSNHSDKNLSSASPISVNASAEILNGKLSDTWRSTRERISQQLNQCFANGPRAFTKKTSISPAIPAPSIITLTDVPSPVQLTYVGNSSVPIPPPMPSNLPTIRIQYKSVPQKQNNPPLLREIKNRIPVRTPEQSALSNELVAVLAKRGKYGE